MARQVLLLILSDIVVALLSDAPLVAGCHGETCEDGAVPRLVDDTALTELAVVANNTMNRERGLSAYRAELGLDPISGLGAGGWLDLCCGSGRALIEAAGRSHRLVGVDLVDHFHTRDPDVGFHTAPLADWTPDAPFDLVTCVHGLHYLGDKLALLARASTWLTPAAGSPPTSTPPPFRARPAAPS